MPKETEPLPQEVVTREVTPVTDAEISEFKTHCTEKDGWTLTKSLSNCDVLFTTTSNSYNIARIVRKADLVVGCVLVPGAKTPRLVTEDMVKKMRPGSVLVDVAIDQGGSIATIDHSTTHQDPFFVKHGVIHYSVANMPGAVPYTSTVALSNSTFRYAMLMADNGLEAAVKMDKGLANGVNIYNHHCTNRNVAESLGLDYVELESVLDA